MTTLIDTAIGLALVLAFLFFAASTAERDPAAVMTEARP